MAKKFLGRLHKTSMYLQQNEMTLDKKTDGTATYVCLNLMWNLPYIFQNTEFC